MHTLMPKYTHVHINTDTDTWSLCSTPAMSSQPGPLILLFTSKCSTHDVLAPKRREKVLPCISGLNSGKFAWYFT